MPEKSSVLNLPITPDNLCMVVNLQFEYLADLAPDQAEQFCQTDHPESSPGVKQLEAGDSIFLKSKHLIGTYSQSLQCGKCSLKCRCSNKWGRSFKRLQLQ